MSHNVTFLPQCPPQCTKTVQHKTIRRLKQTFFISDDESEAPLVTYTKTQEHIPHQRRGYQDKDKDKLAVLSPHQATEDPPVQETIGPIVINVTRLLQDSVLSATSRISDCESRDTRTAQRNGLLKQLLVEESEKREGKVALQKLKPM